MHLNAKVRGSKGWDAFGLSKASHQLCLTAQLKYASRRCRFVSFFFVLSCLCTPANYFCNTCVQPYDSNMCLVQAEHDNRQTRHVHLSAGTAQHSWGSQRICCCCMTSTSKCTPHAWGATASIKHSTSNAAACPSPWCCVTKGNHGC